jgi:hypothetical protein
MNLGSCSRRSSSSVGDSGGDGVRRSRSGGVGEGRSSSLSGRTCVFGETSAWEGKNSAGLADLSV